MRNLEHTNSTKSGEKSDSKPYRHASAHVFSQCRVVYLFNWAVVGTRALGAFLTEFIHAGPRKLSPNVGTKTLARNHVSALRFSDQICLSKKITTLRTLEPCWASLGRRVVEKNISDLGFGNLLR